MVGSRQKVESTLTVPMVGLRPKVHPKLMVGSISKVGSMAGSRQKVLLVESTPKVGSKLMAGSRRKVLMIESKPTVGSNLMAGLKPKVLMVESKLMAGSKLMAELRRIVLMVE